MIYVKKTKHLVGKEKNLVEKQSMFMDRKPQYCEDVSPWQHDLQILCNQPNSIKLFCVYWQNDCKVIQKNQRFRIASTILKDRQGQSSKTDNYPTLGLTIKLKSSRQCGIGRRTDRSMKQNIQN